MDCQAIRNLFSDYADQALAGESKTLVDQHLAQCPACSREFKLFFATVRLLSSLPEIPAPPNFLVSLRNRLEKTPAPRPALLPLTSVLSSGRGRNLALAASFLLVFTLAFLVGRYTRTPGQAPLRLAKSSGPAEAWTPPEDPLAGIEWQIPIAAEPARGIAVSTGFRIPDALEVEYTAHSARQLRSFPFQTPTEFVIALLKADPAFRFADLYPLPQGALALTSEHLYQITLSDPAFAQAPAVFSQNGHRLPPNLAHAQRLYSLRIRRLASPLSSP